VINIDPTPIGRTPRRIPATHTKVVDPIRDLFALLPASKVARSKEGHFSFNEQSTVPGPFASSQGSCIVALLSE